jgi:hypothetical protein
VVPNLGRKMPLLMKIQEVKEVQEGETATPFRKIEMSKFQNERVFHYAHDMTYT